MKEFLFVACLVEGNPVPLKNTATKYKILSSSSRNSWQPLKTQSSQVKNLLQPKEEAFMNDIVRERDGEGEAG